MLSNLGFPIQLIPRYQTEVNFVVKQDTDISSCQKLTIRLIMSKSSTGKAKRIMDYVRVCIIGPYHCPQTLGKRAKWPKINVSYPQIICFWCTSKMQISALAISIYPYFDPCLIQTAINFAHAVVKIMMDLLA